MNAVIRTAHAESRKNGNRRLKMAMFSVIVGTQKVGIASGRPNPKK
jgi:hypothetical protein